MNNLDNAQTKILEGQSKVGARLNTLEALDPCMSRWIGESGRVVAASRCRLCRGGEPPQLRDFVLEAAQQSFARIANLSLFNSL